MQAAADGDHEGEGAEEDYAFGRDSVLAAIEAVREGKCVVVTDDEGRENEGDLIFAADKVSTLRGAGWTRNFTDLPSFRNHDFTSVKNIEFKPLSGRCNSGPNCLRLPRRWGVTSV